MPRFSIIVPVLGIEGQFDDTLASVLRHRPNHSEVIVVHDGTYANPYCLKDEIRLISADQRPNLIRFFNVGTEAANGEFIALLRPGISINEGWQYSIAEAFQSPRVASVSPAIVSPAKPAKLVAAGVNHNYAFHRHLVGTDARLNSTRRTATFPIVGPTSWAAFYRKSQLDEIGSIDTRFDPHFLDLEIGLSLKQLGHQCLFKPECAVFHDFPRMILRELNQAHGMSSQRALIRHAGGADFGRTLLSIAREFCASPFSTWQMEHAMARLAARKFKAVDTDFAERLLSIKRNRIAMDEPVQQRKSVRRAA